MRLAQALGYFVREAALSLRRGWKVSLLAVLTIATSLFVGGVFLLLAHNLSAVADVWRSQARIVAYLAPEATAAHGAELAAWLRQRPGVEVARVVTGTEARERLLGGFPGLAGLVDAPGGAELPISLEISLAPTLAPAAAGELAEALRAQPRVEVVDDDGDWLDRLDRWVAMGRLAGFTLGGLLLVAAVFTIYSVLRLTAHLYREEIAVMRLVGATELLIRGPFYLEGLLQGLLGGALALSALAVLHAGAVRAAPGFVVQILVRRFLPPASCVGLFVLGGAAGLLGAVLSLRREVVAELAVAEPSAG